MKIYIIPIICAILLLSSCSAVETIPVMVQKPKLDINLPQPLRVRSVVWKVHEINDVVYFSLDEKNFDALVKNTEDVQNRLFLQQKIIEQQKQFYEEETD